MWKLTMEPDMATLSDDRALDLLAGCGIAYLSVPFVFFDQPDEFILARSRAFAARGMVVDTCHTPYGGGNKQHSACSELEDIRLATAAMWRHYLARFALVGVRVAPMHTGGCMRVDVPERFRDNLTRTLEAVLPAAEASGVIIALENTFYLNPPPFAGMGETPFENQRWLGDQCALLRYYVKANGHPMLKSCLDIGHSNFLGHDPLTDYDMLRGTIALLHLHDNNGQLDQHFTPGMGCVPWTALARRLAEDAYDQPMYVEALGDPDPARKARIGTAPVLTEIFRATMRALGSDSYPGEG